MSEKLAAPIDELTFLPLPVSIEQSRLPAAVAGEPVIVNDHHGYYPAKAIAARGEWWMAAVRQLRLQRLPVPLHIALHKIFDGPPLPETEDACFKASVFALAGYIPPYGVAFDSYGSWRLVALPEEERTTLW